MLELSLKKMYLKNICKKKKKNRRLVRLPHTAFFLYSNSGKERQSEMDCYSGGA